MFKKLTIAAALLAATAFGAQAEEKLSGAHSAGHGAGSYLYVGGAYAHSWTDIDTGGFNTAGAFTNFDCVGLVGALTCDDTEDASGVSLFLGVTNIFTISENVSVRGELEYNYRNGSNYVTGSFPGTNPPAFVYSTVVSDYHSGFVNIYLDMTMPNMPVTIYAVGGAGFAHSSVATNDTVVAGSASETDFAFNIGAGASYAVSDMIDLFGDVRYVDLGTTNVPLLIGGAPAGAYTVDHTSVEVRVGVKVKLSDLGNLFGN